MPSKEDAIWYDRKRTLFGLPLSFTKYYLTKEKLITVSGLLTQKEEEVRLYRILDVSLRRSLGQRIFKVGVVHVCSADKSTPEFDVGAIKDSQRVKDLLSDIIESTRESKKVVSREFMDDGDYDGHM